MTTKKKILIIISAGVILAGGVGLYMFNKPARDVQATETDFSYDSSAIVNEYLTDANAANAKYLDEEGNSKVLEITGTVAGISEDYNKQKVILLKKVSDKAGVSATFTKETNKSTEGVKIGDQITVKGVIRSGAAFDADLEMYEDVIIAKCDIGFGTMSLYEKGLSEASPLKVRHYMAVDCVSVSSQHLKLAIYFLTKVL